MREIAVRKEEAKGRTEGKGQEIARKRTGSSKDPCKERNGSPPRKLSKNQNKKVTSKS